MIRKFPLGRVCLQLTRRVQAASVAPVLCRTFTAEEMNNLLKNPYYVKYADKLQKLREADPEAFKVKLEAMEKVRKETEAKSAESKDEARQQEEQQQSGQTKPKTLDSILNLDLVKDRSAEEIEKIWNEYHRNKNYIYAVIPAPEYEEMQKHLQEFPRFLYPIPKGEGYMFYYQQSSDNSCHFTPLLSYQTHQESAPLCLTLEHFTELKEEKGIVLMRGQPDTNVISIPESQLLALQVKMYYGLQAGLKFNLVRVFNNSPADFNHMDLVKEFENYKQDYKDLKEEKKI